jgi:hypothetical protein
MKPALLKRGVHYACRTLRDTVRFARDTSFGTTASPDPGAIIRLMQAVPKAALLPHQESALRHRFDLLGSGWVELTAPPRVALNVSNRRRGLVLRQQIDPIYSPIDWHCDFKSGHRWSARTWHRHIRFGEVPGVDVKIPWELARMQHLPRLALAFGLNADERYPAEFRNQVLDFASTNPPRYGVNWICAMDVAIRMSNWLVAYDLFRSFGAQFDSQFRTTFARLIREHACYVRTHLERRGKVRNNHYLAGIAGLIFACRYLPRTQQTINWLRFATGELIREVRHQFHADGSNFEGSTSYHRLSAEMVIFATAVLAGLPDPPELPAWYCERLARMADFTRALQTPTGFVSQIGDNDSGRFLHLTPMYRKLSAAEARSHYVHLRRYEGPPDTAPYWDSDDQDHAHLLHAAEGLLNRNAPETLEGTIIRCLARGATCEAVPGETAALRHPSSPKTPQGKAVSVCRLEIGYSPVTSRAFPDFGVYLFSNREFSLSVRCGGSRGTHAHQDHLSIELHYQGQALFRDPGTFTYTPHPALRHRYRSLAAHAVPFPLEEDATAPVFQAADAGRSECLHFSPAGFLGFGTYGGKRQAYRQIRIQNGNLEITDFLSGECGSHSLETLPYSPGYGKLSSEWISGGKTHTEEIAECVY